MPLPDSLPWMESVDAKIIRAQEHLDIFTAESMEFLKSAVHDTAVKVDGQNAWLVFYLKDPHPPIRLSAIIGDCVANMRSALDNLICGLIRTQQPSSPCLNTRFSIYGDVDHWDRHWRSDLKGVPEKAQEIVKGLQPCFRENGLAQKDPLFVLNKLSNIDKHRALLLTSVYDEHIRFFVHALDGVVHEISLQERIYAENPATIPLSIKPSDLPPNVRVQTYGTSTIALREGGVLGEGSAYKVLLTCFDYLKESVIPRFKPFFG